MPGHHNNKKEPIAPYSAKKNTTELDLDETITSRRRGRDDYRTALLPYDRRRRASQIEGDSSQRSPAAKKLRVNDREEEDEDNEDDENNEDNKDDGDDEDDEEFGLANPTSRVGKLLLEWCQQQHRLDHPSIDRKDPANGNSASDDEGIPKDIATTPQQLTKLVSDYVAHTIRNNGGRFRATVVEFRGLTNAELRKINEKHNIEQGGTLASRMKAIRAAADAEAAQADAEPVDQQAATTENKFCLCM